MKQSRFAFCSIYIIICLVALNSCQTKEERTKINPITNIRNHIRAKHYSDVIKLLLNFEEEAMNKEAYLAKGLAYFKLGDFQRAIAYFDQAKPTSLSMKVNMVYMRLLVGDVDRAKQTGLQLAESFPNRHEVLLLQAIIRFREGYYQEAREYYKTALLKDMMNEKAYIGLANLYLYEKQYSKAEEFYLKAISYSKYKIHGYISIIRFYVVMQRFNDAIWNLKLARLYYPRNINLLILESIIYIKLNKIQAAFDLLQDNIERFPPSFFLNKLLIRCAFFLNKPDVGYKIIQSTRMDKFDRLMLLGEYYLRKSDPNKALTSFTQASLVNDTSYLVNYYLGLVHTFHENSQLSLMYLNKSIQSHPGFENSHLLLALIYLSTEKYSLAFQHAQLALKISPNNIPAHTLSGIILFINEKSQEAEYEFEVCETF